MWSRVAIPAQQFQDQSQSSWTQYASEQQARTFRNILVGSSVDTPLDEALLLPSDNAFKLMQMRGGRGQATALPLVFAAKRHSHNVVYSLLKLGHNEDCSTALNEARTNNNGSLTDQYIITILQARAEVVAALFAKNNAVQAEADANQTTAAEIDARSRIEAAGARAAESGSDEELAAVKQDVAPAFAAAEAARAAARDALNVANARYDAAVAAETTILVPYDTTASGPSASGPSAASSGGARKYKSRKSKRSRKLKRKTRR